MNNEEAAKTTIATVKKLLADVGIPADLKEILKDEDVQFLSESAFADACCPGNPRDTSVEEIAALYRSLMWPRRFHLLSYNRNKPAEPIVNSTPFVVCYND